MALQQWALPHLLALLPLEGSELEELVSYTATLPDGEATKHLAGLLGDSPRATEFISSFLKHRAELNGERPRAQPGLGSPDGEGYKPPVGPPPDGPPPSYEANTHTTGPDDAKNDAWGSNNPYAINNPYASDVKTPLPPHIDIGPDLDEPPPKAPPPAYSPRSRNSGSLAGPESTVGHHSNAVIEAGHRRARDEQQMQQMLLTVQYRYKIYNSEIEPEHESDYYCGCAIHQYQRAKLARLPVQSRWSKAVMYPGERAYSDVSPAIFGINPYGLGLISPYGYRYQMGGSILVPIPSADYHAQFVHQIIEINNRLNREAQANIDSREPKQSIWDLDSLVAGMDDLALADKKGQKVAPAANGSVEKKPKISGFRKALGLMSSEEKAAAKSNELRQAILDEEDGRWPDAQWRQLVAAYQDKVGMTSKIARLRAHSPIQYLHLLRAGYLEPIPVAWAASASNPLKFSIEAKAGWRGITPAWRGYEDLAEERLYWVLNHREGSTGMRMKPDMISALNMARDRMATAIEPPPLYFAADDTCHVQHTSPGYSKQVMPPPFRPFDRPETSNDDTMILLDVSGSMDFKPSRPLYKQYLITGYTVSTQPKNKDVARSVVRRFTDAMANHDHQSKGYDMVTFANSAHHIGTINHRNLDRKWQDVQFGGGTRVMTGWQKVKDLHFRKHSESAVHHPVYGWQAGPQTPMLRLLLLLDGEATDMDEFELDLLGLSWAHVTIFLIGVDGCPHHHRHANELQRISDVNHHVSFVDAQGNCPERFVTHELLKRHLGYDISMQEFERLEELPAYSEIA